MTWFGGLTGRSEAVLSKYLILWFNALFKGTEGAQISIENDGRCRQISHQYGTDGRTNKTGTGRIFCRHAEGLFQNSISTDIHHAMTEKLLLLFPNVDILQYFGTKPFIFDKCYKERQLRPSETFSICAYMPHVRTQGLRRIYVNAYQVQPHKHKLDKVHCTHPNTNISGLNLSKYLR